jgi:hypothetical protein
MPAQHQIRLESQAKIGHQLRLSNLARTRTSCLRSGSSWQSFAHPHPWQLTALQHAAGSLLIRGAELAPAEVPGKQRVYTVSAREVEVAAVDVLCCSVELKKMPLGEWQLSLAQHNALLKAVRAAELKCLADPLSHFTAGLPVPTVLPRAAAGAAWHMTISIATSI